jgi:hypothetical protein
MLLTRAENLFGTCPPLIAFLVLENIAQYQRGHGGLEAL